MEEDNDPKLLYTAEHTRNLYVGTLKNMLKKFPFSDSIFKDLGVISLDQVCTPTVLLWHNQEPSNSIATNRELHVTEDKALDQLQEEIMDFTISTGDYLCVETYKSPTRD